MPFNNKKNIEPALEEKGGPGYEKQAVQLGEMPMIKRIPVRLGGVKMVEKQ